MTNSQIRILLVGDYSIFRVALRMLIESEKNLKVIGEVADLRETVDLIAKEKPDLILVDLPERSDVNIDLYSPLNQSTEKPPILMLASFDDVDVYQKCLRLGINGLVLKEKNADVLFKAIEKVCSGEFWFDRAIMGQTIKQLIDERQFLHENPKVSVNSILTEREKQVVDLVCKGLKNKAIAEKLFITETTVRHHLTSVFNKFEITSRLELVLYAFKNNLVKTPVRTTHTAGTGANSHEVFTS